MDQAIRSPNRAEYVLTLTYPGHGSRPVQVNTVRLSADEWFVFQCRLGFELAEVLMGETSKDDAIDWALRDPEGSLDRLEERAERFATISRARQQRRVPTGDGPASIPVGGRIGQPADASSASVPTRGAIDYTIRVTAHRGSGCGSATAVYSRPELDQRLAEWDLDYLALVLLRLLNDAADALADATPGQG